MGFLDGIEKLITEHGSAVILKERIALASDQYAALEKKLAATEVRMNDLVVENERLKLDLEQNKKQRLAFEQKHSHNSNLERYVCDHCASENIKRTGTRPHPTFGAVGLKEALFRCASCGKESAFELAR